MAEFLSQDEIDGLLGKAEDDAYENIEVEKELIYVDYYLGLDILPGTTKDECQDIEIGKIGYISKESEYTLESRLYKCKIVEIRSNVVLLLDSQFKTHISNVDELSECFYKDRKRYDALQTKCIFDKIQDVLGEKINLGDFLKDMKESKNNYPEFWM